MTEARTIAPIFGCLAALAIGCGPGADPAASLAGTALAVHIDELESFVDCDPASNPDGGDFYISSHVMDATGSLRSLDRFQNELVQTWKGLVVIDDLQAAGAFRHEAGRSMAIDVAYNEFDGGSSYDGFGARTHRYDWDDAAGCWESRNESDCVAPGESREFELGLEDDTGPIYCDAALRYRLDFGRVSRSAAEYAYGVWEGSGGQLEITRGDASSAQVWISPDYLPGIFVNPDAEDEITGGGTVRAAWMPNGVLDYTFVGRFVSDSAVRGTITFSGDGESWRFGIEGTRDLDELRLAFSKANVPTIGAVGGPATWSGFVTLRHVE